MRRWWPVPVLVVAVVIVQAVVTSRYASATGHAAEHVSSASAVYGVVVVLGVLLWGVDGSVRRQPVVWVLAAAIVACLVVIALGNFEVIDAIGGDDWTYEQAEVLGPARAGFTAGHELADRAAWATVAAALLLVAWLWGGRAFAAPLCGVALVLTVLVPRWIFPGAGLVVLAGAAFVAQVRASRRPSAPSQPPGPEP